MEDEKSKEQQKQSTMSRAREAEQQLAANYYGFDGFPESMFVFFFFGPFSEARLTGSFSEVRVEMRKYNTSKGKNEK